MEVCLRCRADVWTIIRCSFLQWWREQLGVMLRRKDEEQTWSNLTTYLKTSASTWHCAFCCNRVAAQQGLEERSGMDRLEKIITAQAWPCCERTKNHSGTHRQLPQQDTCRRYIWSRRHAPSWGSRPEKRDREGHQNSYPEEIEQVAAILNRVSNSHQCERPTQPEEYGARSSGHVCQCRRKLE